MYTALYMMIMITMMMMMMMMMMIADGIGRQCDGCFPAHVFFRVTSQCDEPFSNVPETITSSPVLDL